MDFGGGEEIRFERIGMAGVVTLTRPAALNALTHRMVKALAAALEAWRADPAVARRRDQGARAAPSRPAATSCTSTRPAAPASRRSISSPTSTASTPRSPRYPKPYVALIDGIVMGGGVGVSFHGSHRVLTENASFAMPEVGIGFFPDVGGSHLLPDLGGSFGMYLGLTGNRIRYGDALWSGLATHTIKAEHLGGLLERLAETGDADLALREVFAPAPRETDRADAGRDRGAFLETVARATSCTASKPPHPTDEFAAKTLATMRTRSPTSLNVAFRADQRRPDAVDGRLHAHGVPHPATACSRDTISTRASAPRSSTRATRRAGARRRWKRSIPSTIERYFAPLGDRGTGAVSDGELQQRSFEPSAVEIIFAWFHRVIAALLPAVRRALLDPADRRL